MKKRIKSLLGYGVIIVLGVGCILLMCARAEQVNNMEVNYEESY